MISRNARQNGRRGTVESVIPATTAAETPTSNPPVTEDAALAYSAFTTAEKTLIVFLVTFAATFSPLSSFIFFPAISALSSSLHVSIEKINLTVTSYMIVAGIAPAIIGDMADFTGRRVVYLMTMTVYCVANIGIAVQNRWLALFLLRMVQSAGSAATIAIGYGVIADIAAPSERGGFVGTLLLGPNVATAIGPILGGALVQHPGWRWIFWLLAICSGSCVLLMGLLLPETCRFIAGNGSNQVSGIHRSLVSHINHVQELKDPEKQSNTPKRTPARKAFKVPNPLVSLKMLLAKDTILITLIYGIYYANFSCLQASLSTLFIQIYGVSEFQAGLIYLPFGIGSCVGAYCSGMFADLSFPSQHSSHYSLLIQQGAIMNRDYRTTAQDRDITINVVGGDDMAVFPIEKARFKSIWYHISAVGVCTIGYGWVLQARIHMSIALILQFIIGCATAITFNLCGTLLVDIHPASPAAAQAANNIVRCSLAGIGLAVLDVALRNVGTGWTFTILGTMSWGCLGIAWIEWEYGQRWREDMVNAGKVR